MAKASLFQYVVFLRPTEDEADAGEIGKVIVEPTTILAINQQTATIMASRAIPEQYVKFVDRCEVAVRPF